MNTCKQTRKTDWQHRAHSLIYLLISMGVLAMTACQPEPSPMPAAPRPTFAIPTQDIQEAIRYLKNEYDPEFHLLRESPKTAPDMHWLLTDNWLAANVLHIVGETEFAAKLCAAIKSYHPPPHGIIEALAGDDIEWPPRAPLTPTVTIALGIQREERSGDVMEDWEEYADLTLYRALDLYQEGNLSESRRLYRAALEKFDGTGFRDKVFDVEQTYTTYKLALAIYAARRLDEPVEERLLKALLAKQLPPDSPLALPGGFIALYDQDGKPVKDTNTETTAYALLALSSLRPDYDHTFSCKLPVNR